MKAIDFFCLSHLRVSPLLVCLFISYAGHSMAAPPSTGIINPPSELILNLPDKWLEPQVDLDSAFQKTSQTSSGNNLVAGKSASRKANIGCNMDVSSLPVTDDSMTSRLEGKCNFDYRY